MVLEGWPKNKKLLHQNSNDAAVVIQKSSKGEKPADLVKSRHEQCSTAENVKMCQPK
jgi:hypothetical protein